jgi:hypothetical protein
VTATVRPLITEWHRHVAEAMTAQLTRARGGEWQVEPIILDGRRLLRAWCRDVAYAMPKRGANGKRLGGTIVRADGMIWAGNVPCPDDPES